MIEMRFTPIKVEPEKSEEDELGNETEVAERVERQVCPITIGVDKNGCAEVTCPVCAYSRKLDVSKYRGHAAQSLKARCRCDAILDITFDFRAHQRKEVELDGTFKLLSRKRFMSGSMIIRNISMSGVAFIVSGGVAPTVGMRLKLEFNLNTEEGDTGTPRDKVCAEAVVRVISNDNTVGCEFERTPEGPLGFYLKN